MSYGFPGVGRLQIARETDFGAGPGVFRRLQPFSYKRMNPARPLIDLKDKLRADLGPAGYIPGVQQPVEGVLALWLNGSGQTVREPPEPAEWPFDLLAGSLGLSWQGSTGADDGVAIDSAGARSVITVENAVPAAFAPGCAIVVEAGTLKRWAVIHDASANGAKTVLVLDRLLRDDAGAPLSTITRFSGGHAYRLDTADFASFCTLGGLPTFRLEQEDRNGAARERFSGCVATKLAISVDDDLRVFGAFDIQSHRAASGVTLAAAVDGDSGAPWLLADHLDVHLRLDREPTSISLRHVADVKLTVTNEVTAVTDLAGVAGRGGWIVTSVIPTLTLTLLNDDQCDGMPDLFDDQEPLGVSVVFGGGATPKAGDAVALYLPRAVLTTPYDIKDDDLQLRTLSFTGLRHPGLGNLILSLP